MEERSGTAGIGSLLMYDRFERIGLFFIKLHSEPKAPVICLISVTRKGDEQELTDRDLFDTYRRDVYYLCHYMLHNAADAEDICQEVFLKAFQTDRQGVERIKPWLLRIAVNRCKSHLDRRKRGVLKELKHFLLERRRDTEAADEALERKETELETERWLRALPIKNRTVMTLRYIHELSLQEIAETLNIPPGTVKSRLNRGLRQMRKELGKNNPNLKGAECLE
ncbi:RNA polymerase sigma factor [Paenibacillus sp. MZ04-78.2]|uniref:RNA polymerase sigma factor n=1 Tax=Paenibacillus sp. MZ04-78.2 TaxID=2962034 RepID=UPI0020B6BCF9|nr:RNA polymerase sigma factor [Paenibacillus sp. MZ04-78.2]